MENLMNDEVLQIGKSYLFSIPPGWLFSGKLIKITSQYYVFEKATYLENQNESVFNLTIKKNNAKKVTSKANPIFNNLNIRKESLFISTEIQEENMNILFNMSAISAVEKNG